MQEQFQDDPQLRQERVPIAKQESIVAKGLEDKLQSLLLAEPDVNDVMENTAKLAQAAEQGTEPDFSWVPDRLRVQVMSEWNEARDRITEFKESQKESRAERATELTEEREDLELKEAAERAAKMEELEAKFGPVPESGEPVSQRQIPTQVIQRPKETILDRIRKRFGRS